MIGQSQAMQTLREQVQAVAHRRCTVLIEGETGTGKELVARHIHALSKRSAGPFVPVDCSSLPPTLFESQMFGHVRGAFTGAQHSTLGFIRSAGGGTLFLDEIGELPLAAQAKMLRCIQERAVVPVGSTKPIEVDIRIVAATHRDLLAMVGQGTFREDLYYRMNVAALNTAPLRDRGEDIESLATHFVAELAELYEESVKPIDACAIERMISYGWPGNVRELNNAVEHAFILCRGASITAEDLPESVGSESVVDTSIGGIVPLAQAERDLLVKALRAANGNQTRAAKLVGVERHRLRRMIDRHGLNALTRPRPG